MLLTAFHNLTFDMKMMIKLLPIDYCGTVDELSKWHDEWSCEVFGSIDPSRYYKQSGEGGRYLYGVAEDMSLNEEKATRERVLELLLRIRSINQKLSGMSISQHLQYEEREQMKMERKTLYDEYLELVRPEPEPQENFNSEPQQMELKDLLPERLKGDSALRIFQRAIDAGMIEKTATGFKWNGTKARLAYFLGHFLVDGTFPDAAYCELFNENRLAQAYYRLGDNKCGDGKPRGYEEIDALFVE